MRCKICGNQRDNKIFKIKEMMFGLGDSFDYLECSKCGCLQIVDIPEDMEKYYPSNYYSLQKNVGEHGRRRTIKEVLGDRKIDYAIFKDSFIGKILYNLYPLNDPFLQALEIAELNRDSNVLDVGCGIGNWLYYLNNLGFKNLLGIDPYAREVKNDKFTIFRKDIHEMPDSPKFDLILSSQSFEHMPHQLEALTKISELLSENGSCILSTPIKSKYIWEHYGVNWVQIDAPRHFFIHTLKSFEFLAKKAGLYIKETIFDSNEFQFWASEQYKAGIFLEAENSYKINPEKSIFNENQIEEFKNKAAVLNKNKLGDQAIFILNKE
jgi:2-polyprenyl-3-methyl-5-hydroxy-6-metoxy-1,4-benzoquinol methylase